jgi:hypothetical protein
MHLYPLNNLKIHLHIYENLKRRDRREQEVSLRVLCASSAFSAVKIRTFII